MFQERRSYQLKQTSSSFVIPPSSISVTSLSNEKIHPISNTSNDLISPEYVEQLNKHANIREQLMVHMANLSIESVDDLQFQSSILADITQTTNQLTRKTSTLASNKCQQLSQTLETVCTKISYENIQSISTHLLQCAANVMTGINGPLQGRTKFLNQINTETIDQCRIYNDEYQMNMCYQKRTVNNVLNEVSKMISSITTSLSVNLNLNQSIIINTSSVYFSLEKLSTNLLSNRTINQVHLPLVSNLSNSVVLLRSMIEPLSFADDFQSSSTMNFSRSISFSILDENGKNIPMKTTFADPIELIIPRDPNLIIPEMFLQNITNKNLLFKYHLFHLQINYSIHLEIRSMNENVSYLLIYKFDSQPELIKLIKNIDGWDLLCDTNEDGIFNYFLDNNQTLNHQSISFGIRELSVQEKDLFCGTKTFNPPITDDHWRFSSNYKIRSYLSACFYLDENHKWQSDGLLVGPLTNHYQTQCLSTHLTTFTSALVVLPAPKSIGLCSNNDTTNEAVLLLITFGSGLDQYSHTIPADFNFSTTYQQQFPSPIKDGQFSFVNAVPQNGDAWHAKALDHTSNVGDGYMYLVNIASSDTNVVKNTYNTAKPNLRFEVRTGTMDNRLLAQYNTSDIPEYDTMTWSKYGLSFIALDSSVILLMMSNVREPGGNDVAIDDIELRVCSTVASGFCSSDSTVMTTSIMSTTETKTEEPTSIPPSTPSSVLEECNPAEYIGPNCNVSRNLCDMLKPCQNNGTCNNISTNRHGYTCSCPSGFNGSHCELDYRPCQPHTCLKHGKCNETSNTTFHCTCNDGWQGRHCQSMTNYCDNVTCFNKGVCRPLLLNYTCKCRGDSYYGRHCEDTAMKIIIYKFVAKSFAYMAIIAMIGVAMFVVIMDILKYCFGIDPVHEERERMRREKQAKRRKRPVIQRFIYVNAPTKATTKRLSTIIEATP